MAQKVLEKTKKGQVVIPMPGDVVRMTALNSNNLKKGQELFLIVLGVNRINGKSCTFQTNDPDSRAGGYTWHLEYKSGNWWSGGRGSAIDAKLKIIRTIRRIVLPQEQRVPMY